jgi:hypothetical protein
MSRVIGQRWEIYDYNQVKNELLKRGEKVFVKNTPDFGESVVELVSNAKDRSIEELYLDWKNGKGSPFRTAIAQDVIDAKTLADAKNYADEVSKNEWLKPVNTAEELQTTGLSSKKNYLCKVVADPVQSGVYQAIAGWEEEPEWVLYDDSVDLVNEQELGTKIEEHDKSEESHDYIQGLISDEEAARIEAVSAEAQIRNQAITAETSARNQAVTNEANTRATADIRLQDNINETNGNVADLRYDFNSWVGRGGFIDAFDFETATPTQQQLTDYALSQIPTISDPLQIWNNTKVTNLFDGILWVLTNTQNTSPTVFEWTPQGNVELAPFAPDMGGFIVGGNENDPPEVVRPLLNGKGKINLEAIMELVEERLFFIEHHVGDVVVQHPGSLSPIDKQWRGLWVNWTSRASAYRLRTSALPLSNGGEPNNSNKYTQGANYSSGAYVWWQLVTESGKDDYVLLQANQAITNAAEQPDPVKWNNIRTGILVWRKDMLDVNPWTDADLTLGQQIVRNGVNYWIEEIIVYGGKYFAAAGGNRPPFESGTAGDTIRNIIGTFYAHAGIGSGNNPPTSGVFSFSNADNGGAATGAADRRGYYRFDASTVVPTGKENASRALTETYWRLIRRQRDG